jgi:hypothetical protein
MSDEELASDLDDWVIGEQRRVVQLSIGQLVDEFLGDRCADQVIQPLLMRFSQQWVLELAGEDESLRARVDLDAGLVDYHGRDYTPET